MAHPLPNENDQMSSKSHLQPDGSVFPPVTPDPPPPPGYADPLSDAEALDDLAFVEPADGVDETRQ
jgi:hypothetical protein